VPHELLVWWYFTAFLRLHTRNKKTQSSIKAVPPTTPPTTAPIGLLLWLGVSVPGTIELDGIIAGVTVWVQGTLDELVGFKVAGVLDEVGLSSQRTEANNKCSTSPTVYDLWHSSNLQGSCTKAKIYMAGSPVESSTWKLQSIWSVPVSG